MHCPGCGQQQISSETKFCSRCGLPLGLVSEVLAHGGYLPQLAELNKKKRSLLTRKNGLAFSLIWFLFFLFIVTPFWAIVDVEELAGISAVFGIFGGFILMLVSLIFFKKARSLPATNIAWMGAGAQQNLQGQPGYSALPPQQSIPVNAYGAPQAGNWRDTNDLQPTSVTEGTTRLLEKDER
jgi:hypothetical protein